MKRKPIKQKRFEHKLNCFNHRLNKNGYPPLSEIINILKDLFNNQLEWIYDEGDVFENDCFALRYAIEILEGIRDKDN